MTKQRLNNCVLLYILEQLTDNCDLIDVARKICAVSDESRKYFGALM